MLKNSTKIYIFKTFAVIIYSTLQISEKNLRKQIVALFFCTIVGIIGKCTFENL